MTILKIKSMRDILRYSKKNKITIAQTMLLYEMQKNNVDKEQIIQNISQIIDYTKKIITRGVTGEFAKKGLLVKNDAHKVWLHYGFGKESLVSDQIRKTILYSLAISEQNACMGKIIICPTAGSAGVVPATLLAFEGFEKKNGKIIDKEDIVKGYLAASSIGMIVTKNASIAGAVIGCQGECGTASAMAAAGLAQIFSNDPNIVINAASLALKNSLGLVCDPVGGLVQVPCIKRNSIFSSVAVTSCEMALCGVESLIPFDEVVEAMVDIGKRMPKELKETSKAGLAKTKTGEKYGKIMQDKFKKSMTKIKNNGKNRCC